MNGHSETTNTGNKRQATRVVIATTVALTFISFWRASAVVLSDLASTMFYAGGIAEQAVGKSAPWFIIGVMLLGFAIRSVYMESCSMFVRGGVYVVVRDAMGPFMAKLSVSALIFDYLITGPISSVSAGHYIGGLINEFSEMTHSGFEVNKNMTAVLLALAVTTYFWRSNIKGIHESSQKALRILQLTTAMVVVLLLWCPITLLLQDHIALPPAPVLSNIKFSHESLGWLEGTVVPNIAAFAIIIALGHSFLSMSGFETLAQVYREVAYPKLKNLKITANFVCIYALISTGLITLLAMMIIPDDVRQNYTDNLIGGLVMNLAGPSTLKIIFHAFVVLVGAAILSGAVNTSLIGANSVLNRVAEDGVLLPWFRKPHPLYGTTYRLVNLVALLQIVTIVLSRGDVYLLGEAYAFGLVWSFFLKSCGVLVLRIQRKDQEYKHPGNITIAGREIPVGLILTTSMILMIALANLLTKKIATIYGLLFTIVIFTIFLISERYNKRAHVELKKGLEEFNIDRQADVDLHTVSVKPGATIVAVRHYNSLSHLQWVLDTTKGRHRQIVVATIRPLSAGEAEYELADEQYFSIREQELFSHVVEMAEKSGKHVELLVVPAVSPYDGIVQTAANLRCSLLVTGASPRMSTEELARRIGLAWERLPEPKHPFSLAIVGRSKEPLYVSLGPHSPRLWPEDVDLVHHLWLELSAQKGFGAKLHHRDIVGFALRRLRKDLESDKQADIIDALKKDVAR